MTMVAVFGASGFVGSTLVERLLAEGKYDVRPLIHSSGNAGRLARRPIELVSTDILSTREVQKAIEGCEFVVNCSRGSSEVMIRGLRNLLEVCHKSKVKRFVHLSSTAVFGERFTRTTVDETHAVNAARDSYGGKKAAQDNLVRKAAQRGLPAVVLCPPNITGPFSAYLQEIVQTLQNEQLALVNEGSLHVSVVDVQNLVHAIQCAFTAPEASGDRIIVADPSPANWDELVRPLLSLADGSEPPPISLERAQLLTAPAKAPKKSLKRAIGHLFSSDVRAAITEDPLWDSLHGTAISIARCFPKSLQERLKGSSGKRTVSKVAEPRPVVNERLISQQLRNVRFVSSRARDALGYEPIVTFSESHAAFAEWYRTHFGLDSECADLLQLCRACS